MGELGALQTPKFITSLREKMAVGRNKRYILEKQVRPSHEGFINYVKGSGFHLKIMGKIEEVLKNGMAF